MVFQTDYGQVRTSPHRFLKSTPHSFTPGHQRMVPLHRHTHRTNTCRPTLSLIFLNDKSEPRRTWHLECVPCVWWVGHHLCKRRAAARVPTSAGSKDTAVAGFPSWVSFLPQELAGHGAQHDIEIPASTIVGLLPNILLT